MICDDDDSDDNDVHGDDELMMMMIMRCIHLYFAVSYSVTCPVNCKLTECYFFRFFLAKYQE